MMIVSSGNEAKLARGPFPGGKPLGATVHYSAHPSLDVTIKSEGERGFGYHLIFDRDGKAVQSCPLRQSLWHAGKAQWLGNSPNKTHLAFCLLGWGWLKHDKGMFYSFSGQRVPSNEVELRPDNLTGDRHYWHMATPAQEEALLQALLWAMLMAGFTSEHVCGHDEAATPLGRKLDPGGMLSMTMPQLRAELAARARHKLVSGALMPPNGKH